MSETLRFPIDGVGVPITGAYTVFIDESMDGFLGFARPDGYFCYCALMVPTERLADLGRFWDAVRERLVAEYRKATGFALGDVEFKSGFLNQLGPAARRDLGERLAYFLRKNECFVGGFFTTVDGFGLYHLRTDVAMDDEARVLPDDWGKRLVPVKAGLLENDEKMPGVANLIYPLLHAVLEIPLNWLGSLGKSFDVVYDPREKREDAFLLKHVGAFLTDEGGSFKRFPGVFSGATAKVTSADSPGLMLTDLILRDIRRLFLDLPGLLEEASGKDLILPAPQNDDPLIMSFKGMRLKAGSLRPMSAELASALRRPSGNSMLPLYADRLADRKLSCYANWGEARTVRFEDARFADMVD
jgi:hypothetical protein